MRDEGEAVKRLLEKAGATGRGDVVGYLPFPFER